MRRILSLFLTLLMALSLLTACGGNTTTPGTEGSTSKNLTLYMSSDPDSLDPAKMSTDDAQRVCNQIYDPLIFRRGDGTYEKVLVDSYECSEDGCTYTFHLRDGVKFHDGSALKASDVVFSIDHYKNNTGTPYTYAIQIEEATAVDDKTVQIHTEKPNSTILTDLSLMYILSEKAVTEAGDNYGDNPIGTGAYKFVSATIGDKIELTANEDYILGAPSIKDVTIRIIPDKNTATISIQSGDLDYGVIDNASYSNVEGDDNLHMQEIISPSTTMLVINCERFTDVRVRQAISCAVDRQFLIDSFCDGFAVEANTIANTVAFPDATKITNNYGYNIDKANALLKEAGVNGMDIKMKVATYYAPIAEIIKQNLSAVGINIEIESVEVNNMVQSIYSGDFDITCMALTLSYDPSEFAMMFSPESIGTGLNFAHYNDPPISDRFMKGTSIMDATERSAHYVKLFSDTNETMPYVALLHPMCYVAHNKNLKVDDYNNTMTLFRDMHWN